MYMWNLKKEKSDFVVFSTSYFTHFTKKIKSDYLFTFYNVNKLTKKQEEYEKTLVFSVN